MFIKNNLFRKKTFLILS